MQFFGNKEIELVESKIYAQSFDVLIANADALAFLKTIPDETVELVISSPPYNIGKSYENRRLFQDYLGFQKKVVEECHRILKPNGNLCWQIGNYVEKGEVFPLDIYYYADSNPKRN